MPPWLLSETTTKLVTDQAANVLPDERLAALAGLKARPAFTARKPGMVPTVAARDPLPSQIDDGGHFVIFLSRSGGSNHSCQGFRAVRI
jgi:hypothetical protein